MARKSDGCFHCGGKLVLNVNPAKQGRVDCDTCGCSFRFDERVTHGAGCTFAPTEAATPPAASE